MITIISKRLLNAYRIFRQEIKREVRFAEKAHVRSELLKCNGNTNAIWKIINNCLPRKKHPRPNVPDTRLLWQINSTNISLLWEVSLPRKLVTLLLNVTLILILQLQCQHLMIVPKCFNSMLCQIRMSNLLFWALPLTKHLAMIKCLFEYSRIVCQQFFR